MLIISPSIIQSRIIAKHVPTTYAITSTSSLQKRTQRSLHSCSCCEGVLLWVARAPPRAREVCDPLTTVCARVVQLNYISIFPSPIQFNSVSFNINSDIELTTAIHGIMEDNQIRCRTHKYNKVANLSYPQHDKEKQG